MLGKQFFLIHFHSAGTRGYNRLQSSLGNDFLSGEPRKSASRLQNIWSGVHNSSKVLVFGMSGFWPDQ